MARCLNRRYTLGCTAQRISSDEIVGAFLDAIVQLKATDTAPRWYPDVVRVLDEHAMAEQEVISMDHVRTVHGRLTEFLCAISAHRQRRRKFISFSLVSNSLYPSRHELQ